MFQSIKNSHKLNINIIFHLKKIVKLPIYRGGNMRQVRQKNAGHARTLSPLARISPTHISLQPAGPHKKKLALVYISHFSSGLLREHSKFLYDWKHQILCIFECAKI